MVLVSQGESVIRVRAIEVLLYSEVAESDISSWSSLFTEKTNNFKEQINQFFYV